MKNSGSTDSMDIPVSKDATEEKVHSVFSLTHDPEFIIQAPTSAPWQALPVTNEDMSNNIQLTITEPGQHSEEEIDAAVKQVLHSYKEVLKQRTHNHLGYPYNLQFDYGDLEGLSNYSINNLGDPFIESNYGVHSRQFEVAVLAWFAHLWGIAPDDYWGYITNCGTEGNLHGILVGREVFPEGILYCSKESHYSVLKAARMYRMDYESISCLDTGEIDYEELRTQLTKNKGRPAILNINIGTTVKGAVDDLDTIVQILKDCGYEDKFYIHCDGALFGLMIPFVKDSSKVTFQKPIGSVSVSGHKFIGCPMPCGVVMTRKSHIHKLSSNIEYLNSRDATIMGSRNGHAPLYMWYTLSRKGYKGIRKDVSFCLKNAVWFKNRLRQENIKAMLNELSSTVVFERPLDEIFVKKWQLACEGPIAHAVVMPNVTRVQLEEFIESLLESRQRFPPGPLHEMFSTRPFNEDSDHDFEMEM